MRHQKDQAGLRVQLHPATDWFMRGARYGTIERAGHNHLSVRLDATGRIVRLAPRDIQEVYDR